MLAPEDLSTFHLNRRIHHPTHEQNAARVIVPNHKQERVICIKNLAGKTAATQTTIISKGNNTVVVNLDGLAKGIYVSEVSVNGVVVNNQKIIAE